MRGALLIIGAYVIAIAVEAVVQYKRGDLDSPEQTKAKLEQQLDPLPSTPFTPDQNLKRAKELLAELQPTDTEARSDVLVTGITKHAGEAEKDEQSKPQAKAVLHEMADKYIEIIGNRVWASPTAQTEAEASCRVYLKNSLKAPSTSDWVGLPHTYRWQGHPGYFLIDQTVDAQNSFGAKIRSTFECKVVCLTDKYCEAGELTETER